MTYSDFFDVVETIQMRDPLSNVLGTFVKGDVTFSYLEVVKASGHGYRSVAGAYLMTRKANE